jgi:hypothetical protein
MSFKLPLKKIPKKKFNSCFKFVFLTKKFKERWPCITFLKHFLNAMIKNIKIQNIFDIIEISKYMELNKCIIKTNYEFFYLSVSYDFSKFDGSKKIKV